MVSLGHNEWITLQVKAQFFVFVFVLAPEASIRETTLILYFMSLSVTH